MKEKIKYENPDATVVTVGRLAAVCVGSPSDIDDMTIKYDWSGEIWQEN